MSKVNRRVTYRLYPSARQNAMMWIIFETHRELYNAALQERKEAWQRQRHTINFTDQCKSWTIIRGEHEEFRAINAQSGQVTLKRLDLAYRAFYRRVKADKKPGHPRFKSKRRFSGWGYKTHGDGFRFTPGENWRHGKLRISGVGMVKARGVSRLPGEIVSADIRRDATGWLLSLVIECQPQRACTGNLEAGLDWGVTTLATLAYAPGSYRAYDNQRLGQEQRQAIAESQRQLAKALRDKAASRTKRARKSVARHARKLARKRKDRAHKLSASMVREHQLLITEALAVVNMTASAKGTVKQPGRHVAQKAGLNREILDTGPGMLINMLAYKAAEAGCKFVILNTRMHKPSQTCPVCRVRQKKCLNDRHHVCICGFSAGRDEAAALHMLAVGLKLEGREPAWVFPPETPLHSGTAA